MRLIGKKNWKTVGHLKENGYICTDIKRDCEIPVNV